MADNGGLIVVVAFLLIFGGIITLNDSSSTGSTLSQCSDGIDNDGDGKFDALSDGESIVDPECTFTVFDGATATNYACSSWNNESVAPTTLSECGY